MITYTNPIPIPPFKLSIKSFLRFFKNGKDINHMSNDNIIHTMIISIRIKIDHLACQPHNLEIGIRTIRSKL